MAAYKTSSGATFTTVANPERTAAIIELRRSGAAGTHLDARDRRARTRTAARNKAVNDQSY